MLKTQVIPAPELPAYLQPGEIIADRYRLERELGRGSMGTVWSAVHVTLGQRVAIKLISSGQFDTPEIRHRFSTEAKAAARLKTRHAVQVYDDGETHDGTPYIVMEYLEGETLEEKLQRTGAIPLGEAVRIVAHVGKGLARAHAQGIIHRDLKPANIFLARSEEDEQGWIAKVLDFGVAKLLSSTDPSHTKTGTLVGTPLFMSPEQVRGASHVDQRADLYSLGMVFYNMVSGSFAFDAPSYSDVLVKICLEPLPDLKDAAPHLPEPVREWFSRACARNPDDRFQSADEMVEALHQATSREYRAERPSIPDDGHGPSGTVVGYSPPDLGDGSVPPLAGSPGGHGPTGTLRSSPVTDEWGARAAPLVTPSGRPRAGTPAKLEAIQIAGLPRRSLWPLWLAAGAGLGLALAGGGALLFLMRGSNQQAQAAPTPASVQVPAAPLTSEMPPGTLASTAPAELAAPAPPIPSASASAHAGAKESKTSRAGSTATAKRPTKQSGSATRPISPSAPRTKGGAPDIGF